jgi:hypothetical protein
MIELTNGIVEIEINDNDGTINSIRDLRTDVAYLRADAAPQAFRLETDGMTSGDFSRFSCRITKDEEKQCAELEWTALNGMKVTGQITVHTGRDGIEFGCQVINDTDTRVLSLEYPIIANLTEITDGGEEDYVAHSFATGFQVRNPIKHFVHGGAGFRYMPYPESFSGASMQFFAYYGKGKGGLFFAALDGEGYAKWLNFYKNASGLLEASFMHGCEDMGPSKGISVPYPIVVRLLKGRDWQEAADRYKEWAVQQIWCAAGPLAERTLSEDERWLHEQMGAATFGINAGFDRTSWIKAYHEHIRTPIFHILGPDWTNAPQTFYKGFPGGFDDWFPTRFNPDNIACLHSFGDKFAPFEFDYLYDFKGADGELGQTAAQKFPAQIRSVDGYKFPFLCPAHPYTKQFHVRRDEALQHSDQVDAIYYDISANNILKICMDDSHGHPVGAGRLVAQAYRDNYVLTKKAMIQAAGRYVPMGTEMMNELYLDVLDYYQARAGAQPAAPLEGWPIRELLKSQAAELIPMFAYVYHEYGAVRLDGWGKLAAEIGELFYFTVARTYLWGGLYELNYEYSPMEVLDGSGGLENKGEEHYYPFEPRGYALAEERAQYVGMFANLRTGAGNRYMAYGQMIRPVSYSTSQLLVAWYHYNHGKETPEYNDQGEAKVDTVVHSAWRYKDEGVGLLFANIAAAGQQVELDLTSELLPIRPASCKLTIYVPDAEPASTDYSDAIAGRCRFDIPPRGIVLLELS